MTADQDNPRGLDAYWHTALGQLTGGLFPAALTTACVDWWMYMVGSPEKRFRLAHQAVANNAPKEIEPDPD